MANFNGTRHPLGIEILKRFFAKTNLLEANDSVPHPRFTNEEIARRGEEIYASRLRGQLENEYTDQVVIIDVESGEYEIGHDSLAASKRALAKHPSTAIYGLRVGHSAVESFGGSSLRS